MIRKFSLINSLCFMLVCVLSSQAPALMVRLSTEELTREPEAVIVGESEGCDVILERRW